MAELDLTENVKQNILEQNISALTMVVSIDLMATATAKVAGNDIADTLNGSPLIGTALDNAVAARLIRFLTAKK